MLLQYLEALVEEVLWNFTDHSLLLSRSPGS